jgi:glycosyltransferase involved in cell wall biosynthesis
MDENGVAAILGKSKIFLSFSELEGCPLPPVEAALSGCHVIGYTGEGAKEYWDKEIFTEIYSGDIRAFVNAIMNKIAEIDSSPYVPNKTAIDKLANRYSAQAELADMKLVSNKILEIVNAVE